jgi:hypothetical protein
LPLHHAVLLLCCTQSCFQQCLGTTAVAQRWLGHQVSLPLHGRETRALTRKAAVFSLCILSLCAPQIDCMLAPRAPYAEKAKYLKLAQLPPCRLAHCHVFLLSYALSASDATWSRLLVSLAVPVTSASLLYLSLDAYRVLVR